MKKAWLAISVIALVTCLTGIPHLAEGIAARGLGGVNYGPIFFPLLVSGISFWLFKKQR